MSPTRLTPMYIASSLFAVRFSPLTRAGRSGKHGSWAMSIDYDGTDDVRDRIDV